MSRCEGRRSAYVVWVACVKDDSWAVFLEGVPCPMGVKGGGRVDEVTVLKKM